MDKINAIIIVEMMGKPADHLRGVLSNYVDRIALERGVKLLNKRINEAKKIENSSLFTSFAELELELESLQQLITIIFNYMPSHVEIVSPDSINFKNFELNSLCNDLTRKLLEYDDIAKKMIIEKNLLETQLKQHGLKSVVKKIEQSGKKAGKKIKKSKRKTKT